MNTFLWRRRPESKCKLTHDLSSCDEGRMFTRKDADSGQRQVSPVLSDLLFEQRANTIHQDAFNLRSRVRSSALSLIPALRIGNLCADVTRATITVCRHAHGICWPELLSRKLVFNEQLTRHMDEIGAAQFQARE